MSSLGLGFLLNTKYLFPLTIFLLLVTLAALGYHAKRRRGYAPLAAGVLASAGLLAGKFALDSWALTYGSAAVLVAASIWNAWPRRKVWKVLSSSGLPPA